MKRMSKLALALVLVLAMSAGFSACGGGGDFDASTMTIGSSTSVDTLNPCLPMNSSLLRSSPWCMIPW